MKRFLPGITILGLTALAAPTALASVDMSLMAFGTTYAEPGQEFEFYDQITNKGTEPLTSLTYTQIIEGYEDKSFTIEFDPIGESGKRYIAFKAVAPDELGATVSMKIRVTAANGQSLTKNPVSGKVVISDFVPIHRALVEDYTGTWCPWCPQGFMALEGIRRDYPQRVIGIAYHSSDPMGVSTFAVPQQTNYAPTIRVNRNTNDPNNTGSSANAGSSAIRTANALASAAVTMEASEWLDKEHTQAYAKATVEFANQVSDGECQIEFLLLEDGLTGTSSSWKQKNNYAGATAPWSDPLWDIFTKGGSYVKVEFNDVCIANTLKAGSGFTGSIPQTAGRTKVTFEHTFKDVDKIKEAGSPSKYILQNPDKCRIVAILSNRTSKAAINCDWAPVAEASGILDITTDAVNEASSEKEYFTLQGVKVSSDNLVPGLYIVRQGKQTSKVVIR